MLYNYDEKDILTLKNIRKELNQLYIKKFIPFLICFPVIKLLCYVIMGLYIAFAKEYPGIFFEFYFPQGFYAITHSIILVFITPLIIGYIKVLFGKYQIETDFLADKYIERVYGPSSLASPGIYTLVFAFNGKHKIPFGRHLKWSKYFKIEEQDIYNGALLSDEFYIVSVGKHKNLLAFNKKLFTLETEIPQE